MKISTLPPRRAALYGVMILVLTACGGEGGGASQWTFHPPEPAPSGSAAASPSGSPAASPGGSPGASPTGSPAGSPGGSPGASPAGSPAAGDGETIALSETPSLQILRDGQQVTELALAEGQTYTFEVTNEGGLEHNFYIGPAEQLQSNDLAELPGIPNFLEGTQSFEYTATAETAGLEFACTVPGHYEPMHG
ncbi:MAG: hypothetical protein H0U11_04715, partial [Chloroflexi bacterium]|nr:hypothetical protein [Chloroflexota bacterium]